MKNMKNKICLFNTLSLYKKLFNYYYLNEIKIFNYLIK